jgi:hypothetical protein
MYPSRLFYFVTFCQRYGIFCQEACTKTTPFGIQLFGFHCADQPQELSVGRVWSPNLSSRYLKDLMLIPKRFAALCFDP